MTAKTMEDLFTLELKDIYSAETQLVKALPKMAKAASDPDLKAGFEQHLRETENQVTRLEQIAEELDLKLGRHTCEAMKGLVEEGKEIIELQGEDEVRDAGLIAAAQKVEHYEIATYGTLCAWAKLLGHNKAHKLLQETLNEERATDEKLTELAERELNPVANRM
jgi:ferritin-like metal-binding protein YciE